MKKKVNGIDSCNKIINVQILHIHVELLFL